MTTLYELGINNISKGMRFIDKSSETIDFYEIESEIRTSPYGSKFFDVTIFYTDNSNTFTTWYEHLFNNPHGSISHLILIEDIPWRREYKPEALCFHSNKRKVLVSNVSGYWYCPDCPPDKCDLGSLTEDEFLQAVKEQFGGKECKRAPEKRKR